MNSAASVHQLIAASDIHELIDASNFPFFPPLCYFPLVEILRTLKAFLASRLSVQRNPDGVHYSPHVCGELIPFPFPLDSILPSPSISSRDKLQPAFFVATV